jgi:hypothetical protein
LGLPSSTMFIIVCVEAGMHHHAVCWLRKSPGE